VTSEEQGVRFEYLPPQFLTTHGQLNVTQGHFALNSLKFFFFPTDNHNISQQL